jgi:hypothetical protein
MAILVYQYVLNNIKLFVYSILSLIANTSRINKMPGRSILAFGGTGPAGICVVRELLHRKLPTLVYARNPSKLPEDLASNPL